MAKDAERLEGQAKRLRDLKAQTRGVTFKKIADEVGVTERQAQRWFAGDSDVGDENLPALARYLGTTPDYIEYGSNGRAKPPTPQVLDRLGPLPLLLEKIEALEKHVTANTEALVAIEKRLGALGQLQEQVEANSGRLDQVDQSLGSLMAGVVLATRRDIERLRQQHVGEDPPGRA